MTKHERIGKYVLSRGTGRFPACYELFFSHFNAGEYYEAHDVLEIESSGFKMNPWSLEDRPTISLAG